MVRNSLNQLLVAFYFSGDRHNVFLTYILLSIQSYFQNFHQNILFNAILLYMI